jgi:hypothetical protein
LCRQFQQIDLYQLIIPFRIRGLSYPLFTVLTAIPRCEVFEVEAIRNTRIHLLSTDHVGDPKSNPDSAAASVHAIRLYPTVKLDSLLVV